MNEIFQELTDRVVQFGPNLLAGLVVLVVGWLVALVASFLVRKGLDKVSVDNKIAQWVAGDEKTQVPIERWVGKAVFYLVMVFVVVAFLETIKLDLVTEPFSAMLHPLMSYLPHLLAGGLLIVAAWLLATILKKVITVTLKAAKIDEKFSGAITSDGKPMSLSSTFADVIYWLVFLLFLPAILQALQMESLLEPVTTLLNKIFAFLPNIISAAAIGVVGWFIARIVQRLTQGLLAGAGVDQLSEKWGLAASLGKQKLSGVLGLVVYFVILVPVLISALGALQLETITKPASDMLNKILGVMPNIIGAAIIVLIAVVIGKVISGIVSNLLASVGFNNILVKLGLAKAPPQGRQTPAAVVGTVIMAVIVLLASVTAANLLEFQSVGVLIQDFLTFAGHILMGVLIFGLGLWLAQLVAKAISTSDSRNARRLALVARVVILALAGAMALRQTGLANEIVNLAFGLTLGAVAVAFAIAFGLGGRDLASRTLEEWREKQKK